MANKKINELDSRSSLSLSDLMAVGDPSTGYLYKTTISDLKTLTGAGVVSFNGRFGSVVPAEGDYSLTQLSDVIITSASNNQVLRYNGSNWVNATIDLSGYVPYTGATGNVNLGSNTLLAAQIKATSSAGLSINANSGTQIADLGAGGGANMTLFGGLTGTSASFSSSVTGNTIVKTGGTSSQFLKADGSVDSSTYLTTSSAASTYVPLTRTLTINGTAYDLSADRTWTIPTHDAVTIGTANGLSLSGQALSLALASTSTNGALSSTDWNTFNGKQAALNGTGFVKISGTTISYDNSTYLTTASAASTYLPLAGGTLTGALNGTSAVFSSTVQASAYRLTGMTAGSGALYWTSDRVTLANYNASGVVHIEANGGTNVAIFGGATYKSDFAGTGRFTGDLYASTGIFTLGLFTSDETKYVVPGGVSSLLTLNLAGALTGTSASFSSSVSLGTLANSGDVSKLNIKQASTAYNNGIYLERGGERNGYFMYIGGSVDSLTFRRNYFGTQSDVMSLTRDGNVGIGTSAPPAKLSVNTNAVGLICNLTDGIYQTFQINTRSDGFDITNPNSGYISFSNTTERMRIGAGALGFTASVKDASDADSKTFMNGISSSCGLVPVPSGTTLYLYSRSGGTNYRSLLVSSAYFTGQHGNKPVDMDLKNNIENYVGMIVSSVGTYYSVNPITNEITTGKDAIKISESLPEIKLTNKDKDKSVWGVVTNVKNDNYNTDGTIEYDNTAQFGDRLGEDVIRVNGLGEGAIWVTNINGNLENGDYICSSEVPGYGRKQDDDLLHSYTVAKSTMDCEFDIDNDGLYLCEEFEYDGQIYKRAFVGCTYHCA